MSQKVLFWNQIKNLISLSSKWILFHAIPNVIMPERVERKYFYVPFIFCGNPSRTWYHKFSMYVNAVRYFVYLNFKHPKSQKLNGSSSRNISFFPTDFNENSLLPPGIFTWVREWANKVEGSPPCPQVPLKTWWILDIEWRNLEVRSWFLW